eukprot:TRINITY_DN3684_c0_g2_i1.p1 TRINITY_DN3684_c0_g2~~TRINITY_DN3684_c0_g2_i1.p1  ORF type:complete len:404 (+),score=81.91 TRINITY_DN3684_c0_g2_i1:55-1266(+)
MIARACRPAIALLAAGAVSSYSQQQQKYPQQKNNLRSEIFVSTVAHADELETGHQLQYLEEPQHSEHQEDGQQQQPDESWYGKATSALSQYLPKLPKFKDAGRFDDMNRENRDLLEFEVPNGFTFEYAKTVIDPTSMQNPTSQPQNLLLYRHSVNMGSSEERGGSSYEFHTQFMHATDGGNQLQSVTQFAPGAGGFFQALSFGGPKFSSVLRLQEARGPMGNQQSVSGQLDFKVFDIAWATVNCMPRGIVMSYLQPVHSNVSMGGSLIGTDDQNILIGGSRYDDGTNFGVYVVQTNGMKEKISWTSGLIHTLHYGRKVSADVTMLSMYTLFPDQLNSRFAVGLKYEPKKNERVYRVSVDCDGKISAMMDNQIKFGNFAFKFGLGAEVNHAKNEYHTGFTVSLG